MGKVNQYGYYSITRFTQMAEVEFAGIADYIRMLNDAESKIIFYQSVNDESPLTHFFFQKDNTMYSLRNQEYARIEDYENAQASGFPNAKDYYEAAALGFKNFTEYESCREAGLADKQIFEKAKSGGFIEGYSRLNEKVENERVNIYFEFIAELIELKHAVALCNYAASKGFGNYRDFEKGLLTGFRSMGEWTEAKRLGFDNGQDYRKAIKNGFENYSEFHEANVNSVNTKKEYLVFKKLSARSRNNTMDEIILFDYISSQPNGRKIAIVKMEEHLEEDLKHYYFTADQAEKKNLPSWFTRSLFTRDNINAFVYKDPKMRQVGIFDPEGQYFEIFKIRESIIFVDGSNVAYSSAQRPEMRRIFQVVKALKDQRFPNVVVIADASLKHKVNDSQHKKNVETLCSYIEAPAGTAADEFLIDKARRENGFIVTNDTFRDWKEKDKWIAEHIDKIRIPFIIQNQIVTFSTMEKFAETENRLG